MISNFSASNMPHNTAHDLARSLGVPLSTDEEISAAVVTITPTIAEKLLDLNYGKNRTFRTSNEKAFVRLLKNDEYFGGSPIVLSVAHNPPVLVDGQHRLSAIVESGLSATAVLVTTTETANSIYSKLDRGGMKRTMLDAVTALGFNDDGLGSTISKCYLSALGIISINMNPTSFRFYQSAQEMESLAESYLETLKLLAKTCGGPASTNPASSGLYRAGVLAVALYTTKHAPSKGLDFWGQVVRDDGVGAFDARKRLHEWLSIPRTQTAYKYGGYSFQVLCVQLSAYCWNAWAMDKPVKVLKHDLIAKSKLAGIALTPYQPKA